MAGPSLVTPASTTTIKFLCSYGGKILPRYPDFKLRYHGGHTRVLSVHRSISFTELLFKLGEMCGETVSLRCQLPTEDLDSLVSITSDEDLANLIEEYDRVNSVATPDPTTNLKIRAFLSLPKKISSATSTSSSSSSSSASSSPEPSSTPRAAARCHRRIPAPASASANKHTFSHHPHQHAAHYAHGNPSRFCLIHNGNY